MYCAFCKEDVPLNYVTQHICRPKNDTGILLEIQKILNEHSLALTQICRSLEVLLKKSR